MWKVMVYSMVGAVVGAVAGAACTSASQAAEAQSPPADGSGVEISTVGQNHDYEPSVLQPFGAPHPDRPEAAKAFDFLIGHNTCIQSRFAYPGGEETRSRFDWVGYYSHGGWAVRDEGAPAGSANLSLRIYDPVEGTWHVWYFLAQNGYYAGEWRGGAVGDRIVLEKDDVLEGRPIVSRLEFWDVTPDSFEWRSSNVEEDGAAFVDWRISCEKARY